MISEVKATFEFKRITPDVSFEPEHWQLTLKNKGRVYEHILEYIVRGNTDVSLIELDAVIKKPSTPVKRGLMGYYRAEIVPKALYGLTLVGYFGLSEKDVSNYLNGMFFTHTLYNDASEPVTFARHLSDANDEQMSVYCNLCIEWIEHHLKVNVETTEEYYAKKGNVKRKKR